MTAGFQRLAVVVEGGWGATKAQAVYILVPPVSGMHGKGGRYNGICNRQ